ncbi:hypothetical protein INR49_029845 [Caranx melampygus]|nr:hypothetical protein INR49_029845 [Caranx melampygus]
MGKVCQLLSWTSNIFSITRVRLVPDTPSSAERKTLAGRRESLCSFSKICCLAISIISLSSASFSIAGKPQDAQPGEPLTPRPLSSRDAKNRSDGNKKDAVILECGVTRCICEFKRE